jgi:putative phosphoribosyl transferase
VAFHDRVDAGRQLVSVLGHLADEDCVVLGLPRGGVVVAAEVARGLRAPLDVLLVRKLGVPFQPELAMGAIGEEGIRVWNRDVLRMARVTGHDQRVVERREKVELHRRLARYRAVRHREPLAGRVAVLVDDGIATGATARAACQVARAEEARRVVVAVPVASRDTLDDLQAAPGVGADDVVCLTTPEPFLGVGHWYEDFAQTSDDEVRTALAEAQAWLEAVQGEASPSAPSSIPTPTAEGSTS